MEYNVENIEFSYSLISAFLVEFNNDILDISYTNRDKEISFQIVLLEGKILPEKIKNRLIQLLPEYNITIKQINLSREQFNMSKGEWLPRNYKWLESVLFSKAEVL
jgi:hypothetical protein